MQQEPAERRALKFLWQPDSVAQDAGLALEVTTPITEARAFVALVRPLDRWGEAIDPGDASWPRSELFDLPYCYVGDPRQAGSVALRHWRSQALFHTLEVLIRPFRTAGSAAEVVGRLLVRSDAAPSTAGLRRIDVLRGERIP